jgi:hypothetical protein
MGITKEEILAADDLPKVEVKVPEWGAGKVALLRMMTSGERDAWEIASGAAAGIDKIGSAMQNARARLVAFTLCDESGNLLFTEAEVEALGKKSQVVLNRLADAAFKLNKLGAKSVEDTIKN